MNNLVLMSLGKYVSIKINFLEENCLVKGYIYLQFARYCQISFHLSCINLYSHKQFESTTAGTLKEYGRKCI